MDQVASINDYAKTLLQVAAQLTATYELAGFAIVLVPKGAKNLANCASENPYEMSGMLQALAVTSSLAAQKADMEAAQQAAQQKPSNIIVPN